MISQNLSIGFTGSRKPMTVPQAASLAKLLISVVVQRPLEPGTHRTIEFHHGDCVGADLEGAELASLMGMWVVAHPPSNPKLRAHHPSDDIWKAQPYLERNQNIVDESNLLIAVPMDPAGERMRSGTWATVRRARKAGLRLFIIRPDGEVEEEQGNA